MAIQINGKEINDERISMNISTVSVNQEILMTKEVPLEFVTSGKPAEGYALTGTIHSDVEKVQIAGKKSVLDSVDSIVIPRSVLDVEGLSSNLEVKGNEAEKEMIDKIRCRNGNLEITVSKQETAGTEL